MLRNSQEILNAKYVGDMFTNDADIIKRQYRIYMRQYHPDFNGNSGLSNEVCSKIIEMYNRALELISRGEWEETNTVRIPKPNGKTLLIKFDKEYNFELGKEYVSQKHIVYVIKKEYKKFYENYLNSTNLNFSNDTKMEQVFKRCFPRIVQNFESTIGYVIAIEKDENEFPLEEVLKLYNGKIPDRHVAWIISRLCNIVCFLQKEEIVNNGIKVNNLFINPYKHSISLYGGWWYTTKVDHKMIGISSDMYKALPPSVKTSKLSKFSTDLQSIKSIGKKLLGAKNQIELRSLCPKPFYEWLMRGSLQNAVKEFISWDATLLSAYGKRKFVNMEIDKNLIYK